MLCLHAGHSYGERSSHELLSTSRTTAVAISLVEFFTFLIVISGSDLSYVGTSYLIKTIHTMAFSSGHRSVKANLRFLRARGYSALFRNRKKGVIRNNRKRDKYQSVGDKLALYLLDRLGVAAP